MKTMHRPVTSICAAAALGLTASCSANADLSQPVRVEPAWLAAQHIAPSGTVVGAQRIDDKEGEHVLVLARQTGPSPSRPNSGRIEHIELTATLYAHAGAIWKPEWTIRDMVDCPNLDSVADFFPKAVTFTDLNGDGRVEVTVPYHLFCGGGIDTHTVKVILREGATKLAIRGESRMLYPGQEPFGGEHQYDKALLQPDRAAYKRHLDRVWQEVSVFRYRQ